MNKRRTAAVYGGSILLLGLLIGWIRSVGLMFSSIPASERIILEAIVHFSPVFTAYDVATALLFPAIDLLVAIIILGVHIVALNKIETSYTGKKGYGYEVLRWILGPLIVVPMVFHHSNTTDHE